jgi:hypothetical protein
MRLSVLVTQLQKDSQLLWRPLRIAVDIEEKKTDEPFPKKGIGGTSLWTELSVT